MSLGRTAIIKIFERAPPLMVFLEGEGGVGGFSLSNGFFLINRHSSPVLD